MPSASNSPEHANPPPARSRRPGFAAGVIAAGLLLAVLVVSVSSLRSHKAEAVSGAQAEALPVATLTVSYADSADVTGLHPGLVAARRESALGFETGGRIAEVLVREGDRVEAGQTLARLDVRATEARLAAARAEARAAEAQADLAWTTLDRQAQLLERGHVSAQRLDEAGARARAAAARAAAARAGAEALAVQLALSALEAPYDGVVTARLADEGAIAQPGAPVLRLVEDGALEFRAGLPAGEAGRLEPGRTYPVRLASGGIEARLRAATGVIDRHSRSVEAVFDIAPGQRVSAGEVGRLVLSEPLGERGFWAPVTALAEARRGLWSVRELVPADGGYALEPRVVEIIHVEGERAYLRGAVAEGAMILASGVQRAAPGQRVRPMPQTGPESAS
jgi:membrane fusion protein, multidrug efflux system